LKRITFYVSEEEASISEPFIQGMINRMCVGFHRYGKITGPNTSNQNVIETIKARLKYYEETGNIEMLIDAANFCMIEYQVPKHPHAHFQPMEHEESPGIFVDGRLVHVKPED
jgi:hypothetical protein